MPRHQAWADATDQPIRAGYGRPRKHLDSVPDRRVGARFHPASSVALRNHPAHTTAVGSVDTTDRMSYVPRLTSPDAPTPGATADRSASGRCAHSSARSRWILMQGGRLLSGRTQGIVAPRARPCSRSPTRRYARSRDAVRSCPFPRISGCYGAQASWAGGFAGEFRPQPADEFRPQLTILEMLIVNGFWPHLVAEDGRHSSPVELRCVRSDETAGCGRVSLIVTQIGACCWSRSRTGIRHWAACWPAEGGWSAQRLHQRGSSLACIPARAVWPRAISGDGGRAGQSPLGEPAARLSSPPTCCAQFGRHGPGRQLGGLGWRPGQALACARRPEPGGGGAGRWSAVMARGRLREADFDVQAAAGLRAD